MVFELLGPSLEDLFRYCGNRFSMKTTLMLMDQLLRRVESLHATGHHHRDIKPENFLLGTGKRGNVVYMTDLGLASYRQTTDKRAVLHEAAKAPRPSLIGTCRYASINGHTDVGKFRDSVLLHRLLTRDGQPHRAATISKQWGTWLCTSCEGRFPGKACELRTGRRNTSAFWNRSRKPVWTSCAGTCQLNLPPT
jgi:serine/threonine protein kinase